MTKISIDDIKVGDQFVRKDCPEIIKIEILFIDKEFKKAVFKYINLLSPSSNFLPLDIILEKYEYIPKTYNIEGWVCVAKDKYSHEVNFLDKVYLSKKNCLDNFYDLGYDADYEMIDVVKIPYNKEIYD